MANFLLTAREPFDIFLHGLKFQKSSEILSNSLLPKDGDIVDDQKVSIVAHPAMILSAFASELYLKCLICVETGVVPKGHNLDKLFHQLRVETRRELDDLWDTEIRLPLKQRVIEKLRGTPRGRNLKIDLRYMLKLGAEGFIKLRYHYEHSESDFFLVDLPKVLRVAILRRFPSWAAELPKPSIGILN
jgi:hypothetical protein